MKILGIETSCDETAVCILEIKDKKIQILGNSLLSQVKTHEEWGGVVPSLAKREHRKNIIPLLKKSLTEANLLQESETEISKDKIEKIYELLNRDSELADALIKFVSNFKIPEIDLISVTYGPGLEPALWVGLNTGKALSILWGQELVPVDHMEGHIVSTLLRKEGNGFKKYEIEYPVLALLISGGHTQLVLIKKELDYKIIGETRDDAVGEAFDKVARILDLPYPGGPQISKLGKLADDKEAFNFPRPMINSPDLDFSFSGLKTSVLYTVKKLDGLDDKTKANIAYAFESAVTDVLIKKTLRAVTENNIKTLLVGGGVAANERIQNSLNEKVKDVVLLFPDKSLTGDNAIMIALAGYMRKKSDKIKKNPTDTIAKGNLVLH